MKASFIILNYNRKDEVLITVSKTKELIKDAPDDYEIIVVDNHSSDGSAPAVKERFPDITLIARTENNGIAGWNDGFGIAKGRYFIVLDDDSHIGNGLQEALEYMDTHPETGILALNISGGFVRQEDYYRGSSLQDDLPDGKALATFIGCGAVIRKELYDKIGGFAPWLWIYAHEWEYGIRCIAAGYQIRFFKNCTVFHRVSTINRTAKRTIAYATRNEMMIVYKFYSYRKWKYLARVFFNHIRWRLVNEGRKAAYYTFLGAVEFFRLMRKEPSVTPVSREAQVFFTENFVSARPFFMFFSRWKKFIPINRIE